VSTGEDFSERRGRRAAFLAALYAATDGHVAEFVAASEIAAALGIPGPELARMLAYLEERQWIAVDDHRAGIVRITAAGVDRVEAGPTG
jgi:DNA-binding IclR family transcriptional regulator